LASYIYTLSPQRIVLGGGVSQQAHVMKLIHEKVQTLLNGYVQSPQILQKIENYIVNPGLGNQSGVLGAIALADQAYRESVQ
jgi:fructokinase